MVVRAMALEPLGAAMIEFKHIGKITNLISKYIKETYGD
jgi:hypothetical protein